MGIVSVTLPDPGDPEPTADPQIKQAITDVVNEFNGNIESSNIKDDAVTATKIDKSLPSARVYNSANISTSHASAKILTFDSERFDTDSMHDTSTNTERLTINTAGLYLVSASVTWAMNATGYRAVELKVNAGGTIAESSIMGVSSLTTVQTVTTIYELNAGDYLTVQVTQGSGGSLDVVAQSFVSPEFSCCLLRSK